MVGIDERAKRRRLDFEPFYRGVVLLDGDSPCPEQSRERRLGHRRTDTPQLSPRFRSLRKSTARRERINSGDKHATDDERRHISVQFRHVRQHFEPLSRIVLSEETGRETTGQQRLYFQTHIRSLLELLSNSLQLLPLHQPATLTLYIIPGRFGPGRNQPQSTTRPSNQTSDFRSIMDSIDRASSNSPERRSAWREHQPPARCLRMISAGFQHCATIRVISSFVASAELVFSQLTAEATASPAASCCSLRSVDRCIAVI